MSDFSGYPTIMTGVQLGFQVWFDDFRADQFDRWTGDQLPGTVLVHGLSANVYNGTDPGAAMLFGEIKCPEVCVDENWSRSWATSRRWRLYHQIIATVSCYLGCSLSWRRSLPYSVQIGW